jgi:hypothetical protein
MKAILIGVVTCDRDQAWLRACRETWLRDVMPDFDVVFVDKTFMPTGVEDTVENLPSKTKELCRYGLKNSYRWLVKCDNDTMVRPRLLRPPYGFDYAGRLRGKSSPEYVPPGVVNACDYCSGGIYWLSSRAMQIVVQSPLTKDIAEDRWVGNTLHGFGIHAQHLLGYTAPTHVPVSDYLRNEGCVAVMQMQEPDQMRRAYQGIFDPPPPPTGSRPEDYPVGHIMRTQMRK